MPALSEELTASSREQRRAEQVLDRIAKSFQESGMSQLLEHPETNSVDEINRMLETVDFSRILGQSGNAGLAEVAVIRDAEMRVEVSRDSMTVDVALMPPLGSGRPMELATMLATLENEYRVVYGIDRVAVDRLIEIGLTETMHAVVARGVSPVPGHVATWALAETGKTRDEEARVDFREHSAHKAVLIGDLLAYSVAAEPSRPGMNVHGKVLAAPEMPLGRTLTAGPGTENREDGIHATIAGEILCKDGVLSVIALRRIDGDVDFSTGNVEFPGSVFIQGSIADGFTVRAGGDLEVGGSIAGSLVEASGSIRVVGGILGRNKGRIKAGGEVTAKFIENAHVEAQVAVRVQRGILHSHIDTLGVVEVMGQPGAVVGGLLRTGTGLRCRTLGSVAGTQTRIVFGENFLAHRKLEAVEKAAAFIRDRVSDVDTSLAPFKALDAANLRAESGPTLRKLITLRAQLLGNLQRLTASRIAVKAEVDNAQKGDVRVRGHIHTGVILSSRGVDRQVSEELVHSRFQLAGDWIEVLPL